MTNRPLPRWQYDADYARLLNSLVRALPLRRRSEFTEEALAKRIYLTAEGLIGDIVQNVAAAAAAPVRAGEERITVEIFDSLHLEPPSKRFSPGELHGLA